VRRALEALKALSLVEQLGVLAVAVWMGVFVGVKLPHLFSPTWIEWDARAMALAAFRFHGTDLFPRDLGADLASAMCPPGWKAVYWIGTLFTDPYQVSRLVPFALLGFLLWHAFAFARARGGILVAAVTIFLLARCPFVWDRIVGANPRAFGLPLVVAFLRYASEKRPRAVAVVLVAQAAFYPSALLLCAPAFALLQLVEAIRTKRWTPLFLLAGTGLACALLALPTALLVDPRLGPPIRIEELAQLKQRSMWSLYPLPPHRWAFMRAPHIALEDEVAAPLLPDKWDEVAGAVVMGFAAIVFAIGIVRRRVPLPFFAVAASAVGAYFLACAVAYRLYVPDRMLHYASPPIILMLLTPLAVEALTDLRRRFRHGAAAMCTLIVALTILAGNSGISRYSGLHDWGGGRNATTDYLGRQRKDALVVAHPSVASFVEVFARRSTLFSGITNAPNFVTYGRTVEQRIGEYYAAYYSPSIERVRQMVDKEHVDYLVVDARDFGNDALKRSRYVSPWTETAQLYIQNAHGRFALAAPPPEVIVFREGSVLVIDCKKL
jgi:hypothetical protein